MAARKFKFVSPGVFLKEIDNSQLPKLPGNIGPVIIGRTRKGPALNPVKVNSYAEFVEMFGEPIPGNQGDDAWREGNGLLAPAYAHYAAKAYFAADIDSPVTVIRLLGVNGDNATTATGAQAGWSSDKTYALITYPSGSSVTTADHEVSAIFYVPAAGTVPHLLGTTPHGGTTYTKEAPAGAGVVVKDNADGDFKLVLSSSTRQKEVAVNFTRGSKNYIRSVLNTNPVMTNTNISYVTSGTMADTYWLGETFEETAASGSHKRGYIVQLQADTTDFEDFTHEASAGRTGWVICQHEGEPADYQPLEQDRLFRLIALSEGEEPSRNLIVAIEDIRVPQTGDTDPYGSFSVVIKKVFGTKLEVVESFAGCNLNPNSQNYVARQIGDQYFQWSATEKRNKVYGNYPNNSKYIRIDMDSNVDLGVLSPSKVPFGFYGPVVPKKIHKPFTGATVTDIGGLSTFIEESTTLTHHEGTEGALEQGSVTINWPGLRTTLSASVDGSECFGAAVYKRSGDNLSSEIDTGMIDYIRKLPAGLVNPQTTGLANSNTEYAFVFSLDDVVVRGTNILDTSLANVTASYHASGSRRGIHGSKSTATITVNELTIAGANIDDKKIEIYRPGLGAHMLTFTVDTAVSSSAAAAINSSTGTGSIIGGSDTANNLDFAEDIHRAINASPYFTSTQANNVITVTPTEDGEVATAIATNLPGVTASVWTQGKSDYSLTSTHLTGGINALLDLGFDKFNMPLAGGFDGVDIRKADPFANRITSGQTTANSYAFASIDRAIELIKDPEMIEHNLAVMPGITTEALTTKLVEKCESRADSLAIIDLPNVYKPAHEKKCKVFADRLETTPAKTARALKARQLNSSYGASYYPWVKIKDSDTSRDVWVPPSVVALGVMAYTEQRDEVWFAPAGFNRGGLNEGNAGLPVLQVSEQLLSKQRDTLYEASINPIASFVTEGLVIFGQKTLQTTPSALDRINVRRLLIFVKKEISRIASSLLFDQNVPATWNRFLGQVNPFLQSVKTRLGLSDYKVILDNTTTTPDLVDRNIMYAKIFLKPARAIEFIAVDFVITNTGASFDD